MCLGVMREMGWMHLTDAIAISWQRSLLFHAGASLRPAGFSLVIGAFAMRGIGGLRERLHHAEELGGLAHEDV